MKEHTRSESTDAKFKTGKTNSVCSVSGWWSSLRKGCGWKGYQVVLGGLVGLCVSERWLHERVQLGEVL